MIQQLENLQTKYSKKISNTRGGGSFMAFDCETTEERDNLVKKFKKQGIHISGCGSKSIRIRPALIFEKKKHVDIFINALNTILQD